MHTPTYIRQRVLLFTVHLKSWMRVSYSVNNFVFIDRWVICIDRWQSQPEGRDPVATICTQDDSIFSCFTKSRLLHLRGFSIGSWRIRWHLAKSRSTNSLTVVVTQRIRIIYNPLIIDNIHLDNIDYCNIKQLNNLVYKFYLSKCL